jgi:hypothetical protein
MSTDCPTIDEQIDVIMSTNQIQDLCRFIRLRHRINRCNLCLIYWFHIMQTTGILVSTIAAGGDMKVLMWVGISFHCVASLLAIFEKNNVAVSKKLLRDIEAIKNHTYVDESPVEADIEALPLRAAPASLRPAQQPNVVQT